MKNIHLLPTDKPSRLIYNDANQLCYQSNKSYKNDRKWMQRKNFNIYITSDEEIKEHDWILPPSNIPVKYDGQKYKGDEPLKCWKKIILTTDQDLIKDSIQAISDEFIELFVKNLNCERVEVKIEFIQTPDNLKDGFYYKIIIPQEEDAKETIEEAANNWIKNTSEFLSVKNGFIEGAKWQAERMYSEEEVYKLLLKHQSDYRSSVRNSYPLTWSFDIKEWFEEVKKK
jgi:hypothetical protein